ncbi:transcription factor Cmr1 [Diplocarpon rosae]|nr:transcription factor Cmr1 [Diplocarpon rosae]
MRCQSLSNASTARRPNGSPRAVNRLAPKEPKPDSPPALAVSPMTSRVQSPPKTTPVYADSMPTFNFGTTPLNMSPRESVKGALDTFMCMDEDMLGVDTSYQDLMIWNQYPAELDMFPNPTSGKQFMEMAESYSSSEALVSHSMHTSVSAPHTGSTSISSQFPVHVPELQSSIWRTWNSTRDVNYKNQISVVPFSSIETSEARCLTAGLTETCRISLFNIIEKDVELSADPVVLRCALLFTILGAWSGDAWHMKMAMGQRGMYLSMLKHAGMLEPLVPGTISSADALNIELQWRAWQQQESKNRGEGNLEIRPEQVLGHCVALLEQGVASRVSDGIKRKLLELSRTWVTA